MTRMGRLLDENPGISSLDTILYEDRDRLQDARETEDARITDFIATLPAVNGPSGPESGGLDQTHLVATGGEFTPLVALNHHSTTGLDPDHAGSHPAQSR